tara:strand:- start:194 stop:352 length:159 start_codon:yes stop_codon:yes gene_type:complete
MAVTPNSGALARARAAKTPVADPAAAPAIGDADRDAAWLTKMRSPSDAGLEI